MAMRQTWLVVALALLLCVLCVNFVISVLNSCFCIS